MIQQACSIKPVPSELAEYRSIYGQLKTLCTLGEAGIAECLPSKHLSPGAHCP